MFFRRSLFAFAILLALSLTFLGCTKTKTESKPQSHSSETMSHDGHGHETSTHTMNGTMSAVYDAAELYHCPMHPEMVSDQADAKCASCNMNLKKMSASEVKKLRQSNPRGCPMCPVVADGNSSINKCPTCKMDLQPIGDPKTIS